MRCGTRKQGVDRNIRRPGKKKLEDMIELAELGKKAGVVFHDLANHITALTLSIGYLEDSFAKDSERLREYSKQSEKTRMQMEHVTKILRAHIEREHDTSFCPATEIKRILQTFEQKTANGKIRITHTLDDELKIKGGATAFFHIMTNLISNAIESFETVTDDRQKIIRINLTKIGQKIIISVTDTGSGIDSKNIGKIFEPNFTTKKRGHGIGLSAVKEYVEKTFQGKITVESSVEGTRFQVTLPSMNNIPRTKGVGTQNNRAKQNRKRHALPVFVN